MELDDAIRNISNLTKKIYEIKKLYDISEAEMQCLIQMSMLIKMLGYSPQLTTKLLKTLAAVNEMLLDEMKDERNTK